MTMMKMTLLAMLTSSRAARLGWTLCTLISKTFYRMQVGFRGWRISGTRFTGCSQRTLNACARITGSIPKTVPCDQARAHLKRHTNARKCLKRRRVLNKYSRIRRQSQTSQLPTSSSSSGLSSKVTGLAFARMTSKYTKPTLSETILLTLTFSQVWLGSPWYTLSTCRGYRRRRWRHADLGRPPCTYFEEHN